MGNQTPHQSTGSAMKAMIRESRHAANPTWETFAKEMASKLRLEGSVGDCPGREEEEPIGKAV